AGAVHRGSAPSHRRRDDDAAGRAVEPHFFHSPQPYEPAPLGRARAARPGPARVRPGRGRPRALAGELMSSALGDRLRRLRRSDAPMPQRSPAAPEGLARLEARLIGATDDDGLSLKERLERLVAVAARRPRANGHGALGPPLEELLSGRRV